MHDMALYCTIWYSFINYYEVTIVYSITTLEFYFLLFQNSLNKKSPKDIESPGRSGARFLESYDKRYVIKTLVSEEVAEMHRILNNYHQVSVW